MVQAVAEITLEGRTAREPKSWETPPLAMWEIEESLSSGLGAEVWRNHLERYGSNACAYSAAAELKVRIRAPIGQTQEPISPLEHETALSYAVAVHERTGSQSRAYKALRDYEEAAAFADRASEFIGERANREKFFLDTLELLERVHGGNKSRMTAVRGLDASLSHYHQMVKSK